MTISQPFLTASWKELSLLNFKVEPAWLQSLLPPGLTADLLNGEAYASLVSFDFENVRVGGIPWPGYTQFPEFNLRVYVRRQATAERGVLFIRELIPYHFPARLARLLYNEPYTACRLTRNITTSYDGSQLQTTDITLARHHHHLRLKVGPSTYLPSESSPEHWFKEQTWGFGRSHSGTLLRYQVEHPTWLLREVHSYELDLDWHALYGPIWAKALSRVRPASIIHAVGSDVRVYFPEAFADTGVS